MSEELYDHWQEALKKARQMSDLAFQRSQRAMEAEELLLAFLDAVQVGAIGLENDALVDLWQKYHDFLASPDRVNKAISV